ncbi:hypothetical protein [Oscillatoria sp. HE19RPO]|uniref:hypothetical protein n=1 Tax=Oscillatoria sp. HE19RPO TaxID=2954806 RepID=UPI0020C34CFD|nr:hypothetical protein [Oscillatoria sp. HE19RPO]
MDYTLKEAKVLYRKALKLAKESHWFTKIDRPYPKLAGYEPFATAAKNLAHNLLTVEWGISNGQLDIHNVLNDIAWNSIVSSAWTLAHNEFPVWWLDKDLFAAFDQSDVPRAIGDLEVSVPFGIIMLPRDKIANPEDNACDWVFFQHLPKGLQLPPLQLGGHTIENAPIECDKFRWATILREGTGYASTIELVGDQVVHGDFEMVNLGFIDSNQDLDLEEQFQKRIERIVLQTLLYSQTRPDDLTPPAPTAISTKGQGFSSGKSKSERFSPLIIGQKFQPKTERATGSTHSTHTTPRTHWRRGHWRRVAIGEGRQQREWRWIQPVLVNG